ncbi:hypothetical protein B0H13DRAFT_1894023 [Mycena leptocephala]|nr:hypothetical protein B0H13DRAFT_1894023 [Mycena leptocephala]
MVNFLHNITALAGAATLVKIFDNKNQLVNLAGNVGVNGVAIFTYPETAGAPNEDVRLLWFLIPQENSTFTLQTVGRPAIFASYATAATKAIQGDRSQVVASSTSPLCSECKRLAPDRRSNSTTGSVMTAWVNPDPGVWDDAATPLTMEGHNGPPSKVQSFTITLCQLPSSILRPFAMY